MKYFILLISFSLLILGYSSQSFALENAGKTIVARGQVEAKNQQDSRKLNRRSPIFSADTVITGENSNTQLRMIDGGLLSLQQQTQLVVENYQYDQVNDEGSITLNLLKGGLRTVTGALKKSGNRYTMQTPIASIGVRGTHFEAELEQGDLYLSVWQGVIDVGVTVGNDPIKFSLGEGENFNFAIVRAGGTVEFTLTLPSVFAQGHSEKMFSQQLATIESQSPQEQRIKAQTPPRRIKAQSDDFNEDEFDNTGKTLFDNDRLWAALVPDFIAPRSGLAVFDQVLEHTISSSSGEISDLSMSMAVNFDTGRVPTGNLSFNDSNGQWFAVFNGIIIANILEVNINFASYNNNLVDGFITGILLNNGSQVLGNLSLSEVSNPANNAGGSFLIIETP